MMEIPRILYSSPFMGNYFCEIAHYNMAFVAIAKNAVTYLKSLAIYAKFFQAEDGIRDLSK